MEITLFLGSLQFFWIYLNLSPGRHLYAHVLIYLFIITVRCMSENCALVIDVQLETKGADIMGLIFHGRSYRSFALKTLHLVAPKKISYQRIIIISHYPPRNGQHNLEPESITCSGHFVCRFLIIVYRSNYPAGMQPRDKVQLKLLHCSVAANCDSFTRSVDKLFWSTDQMMQKKGIEER